MVRATVRWALLPLLLSTACAIPNTIDMLDDSSPPNEFGRPGWVRTVAGVGGWIGGITGGVVSVVLLPVTYPLSLVAGDELTDHAADEVILFPATTLAAGGHAALGMPADLVDWMFRRVWIGGPDPDPVARFDHVPLDDPQLPTAEPDMAPPTEPEPATDPEAPDGN